MKLKNNVSEIKKCLQERKETNLAFTRFLISKGISPTLTEEILHKLAQDCKEFTQVQFTHLQEALASALRVTGELTFEKARKLVFVGPTGVGKTTTLLKLADYYRNQKKSVSLMSLDGAKQEELRSWAKKKNIAFKEKADSASELLLIDTEGCNFYLPHRVDVLGEKLSELGEDIELVLTLSAAAKEVDLYGAVHQFSALCPHTLCFTKLDETLAAGVVLNVAVKSDLPIRYIAYGYPLPGEVQIAHPRNIIHKVLTDFNQEEFQFLRQLTISNLI